MHDESMTILKIVIGLFLFANNCGDEKKIWRQCKTDRDCIIFRNECGARSAYSRNSLREIVAYQKCKKTLDTCPKPLSDQKSYSEDELSRVEPICRRNQCFKKVFPIQKKAKATDQEPKRCRVDSDCILVHINDCCKPDSINKMYRDRYKTKIQSLKRQCSTAICAQVMYRSICRANICSATTTSKNRL